MLNSPFQLFRIIPLLLLLIGVGLLGGAFMSYRATEAFLRTARTAAGEVIGYERRNNSDGEIRYFPVIAFTPAGAEEPIEFTASSGSSTRSYALGSSIALRYDPALPFNATIDTPTDIWLVPIVLSILGVAFSAIGSGIFWAFRPSSALGCAIASP